MKYIPPKTPGDVDISDANAVEANVLSPKTFYSIAEPIKIGTMPTQTLGPDNEDVPAGYYEETTLSTIEIDLATINIEAGITIFGKPGSVDVRNVSDGDALVGEVKNEKTFYAVGGAKKTGTLPTQTLNPANENVVEGFYVATTLSAVEADLITGNIKSGITIFGIAGNDNVRDVSDADALVAEVTSGKTFYAQGGARKTGTLVVGPSIPDLTVARWQAHDGEGDSTLPHNLNDTLTTSYNTFIINQYTEIDLHGTHRIFQYRYFGYENHNEDGRFKLEYWNVTTQAWVEWATGIVARLNTWSGWVELAAVYSPHVRFTCTTADTGAATRIYELEVKY